MFVTLVLGTAAVVTLGAALLAEGWLDDVGRPVPTTASIMRRHVGAATVLLGFCFVAAALPNWLPAHDHNAFVARSDCAWSWYCDDLAPWSAPAYHAIGAALRVFPGRYGMSTVAGTSFGFAFASLVLLYVFTLRFATMLGREPEARRVATWAVALLAFNPIFLRLAVAGTFWPYSMCALLAAGTAAMRWREREDAAAAVAAAIFLGLAAASNWAVLPWAAIFVVAPIAWPGQPTAGRRRRVVVGVVAALFLGALLVPAAQIAWANMAQMGGVGRSPTGLLQLLTLFPGQIPIPVSLLWALGLVVSLRSPRAFAPVWLAYFGVEWVLAAQVPLESGYPTRFVHGFVSLYFIALFAALGAAHLTRSLSGRASPRRLSAVLAVVIAASVPTATDAWRFLTEDRVLDREIRALTAAFDELPPHGTLVLAPPLMPLVGPREVTGEPVEVHFPLEAYAASMRAREGVVPLVLHLDDLVEGRAVPEGDTLLYVGSALRSWTHWEIDGEVVPGETFNRPMLVRADATWPRTPALTFHVATEQNPLVFQRLGADRVAEVELGFYWLGASGGDTPPPVGTRDDRDAKPGGLGQTGSESNHARSAAQPRDGPVITAEHEAEVLALIEPYTGLAEIEGGWRVTSVSIESDRVVFSLEGPADGNGRIELVHARDDDGTGTRSASFAIRTSASDGGEGPVAAVVATIIANDTELFWSAVDDDRSVLPAPQGVWAVGAVAAGSLLGFLLVGISRRTRRTKPG